MYTYIFTPSPFFLKSRRQGNLAVPVAREPTNHSHFVSAINLGRGVVRNVEQIEQSPSRSFLPRVYQGCTYNLLPVEIVSRQEFLRFRAAHGVNI